MAHEACFIYCAAEDGSHLVKIGMAKDPLVRIKMLQTSNSRSIRLVAAFPGGPAEEAAIRYAWGHFHVRGEWHADEGQQISKFFRVRAKTVARLQAEGTAPSVALSVKCPAQTKSATGVGRPRQYEPNAEDRAKWKDVTAYVTDEEAAAAIGASVSTLRRRYKRSGRPKTGRPRKGK